MVYFGFEGTVKVVWTLHVEHIMHPARDKVVVGLQALVGPQLLPSVGTGGVDEIGIDLPKLQTRPVVGVVTPPYKGKKR